MSAVRARVGRAPARNAHIHQYAPDHVRGRAEWKEQDGAGPPTPKTTYYYVVLRLGSPSPHPDTKKIV